MTETTEIDDFRSAIADRRKGVDWHRCVAWVAWRTKITPAEWDPTALDVDQSAAFPPDTFYPTHVALYPLPGEDRWWAPDSSFVNEEAADGGFPLAGALLALASSVVHHALVDSMSDPKPWGETEERRDKRLAEAEPWWERMTTETPWAEERDRG